METEAQRRKLRSRRPLSNLTNIDTTHISSHSSSSSPTTTALALKTFQAQLSSARNKQLNKNFKSGETTGSVINRTTSVNPSSAPPSLDSTPSRPPPPNSTRVSKGSQYGGVWEPLSVYSRRKTSDRIKNKGKAVAEPMVSITAPGDRSDDIEDIVFNWTSESLPKKKQRFMPHEHNVSKNVLPRDYIEKQRAYFDEIDLEPLSVEEIASDAELD